MWRVLVLDMRRSLSRVNVACHEPTDPIFDLRLLVSVTGSSTVASQFDRSHQRNGVRRNRARNYVNGVRSRRRNLWKWMEELLFQLLWTALLIFFIENVRDL